MNTSLKKKKILFTSHVANFQKFNRPFMRMLREKGWEVHYASDGEEDILDCDKEFKLPIERSPLKLIRNFKAYRQLKKIIDREGYDIIHTHTPTGSVVTRLAAIRARKKGTRVIYTAHGFHFFKGAPFLNWLLYYPTEKYMARHTDTIVTINEEDYDLAKRRLKSEVIYLPGVGVDIDRFVPYINNNERTSFRNSLGLKSDDFIIIYPAELSKRKRQLWLLSSLHNLILKNPNIHILLPGKDSLRGKCQRLTSKLHIADQVHFLGYRSDIPELMMSSDIAVSSSLQEGLPVNILEALAASLPVVAIDSRGQSDLIKNGLNGYIVKPNNQLEFSKKVGQLYQSESLRRSMSLRSTEMLKGKSLADVLDSKSKIYGL